MSADPHAPTTAGPTPPPTVPATDATTARPAGSVAASAGAGESTELPLGIPPDRPEILVGAAFAGGVLAAIILKRLGGD